MSQYMPFGIRAIGFGFSVFYCVAGCQHNLSNSAQPASSGNTVSIAALGGTDRQTQELVRSLLEKQGIGCIIEGSAIFEVSVGAKDASKATQILKNARELEDKWIQFEENPQSRPSHSVK